MRAWLFVLAGLMTGLLTGPLSGCDGASFQASVSRTSTVTVGNARAVAIAVPVVVDVVASPVARDVVFTLQAVVTASTTEQANQAAEALELVVTSPNTDLERVELSPLEDGVRIQGVLTVRMPENLDLQVTSPGGARVRGMRRLVDLRTNGGAEVYEASGSVTVSTSGGAIIDSLMLQSTVVDVAATGNIELRLPAAPSVTLVASVAANVGAVTVEHPALPAAFGDRTMYRASVNGGLAQASLRSSAGGVTLRTR